MAHLLHKGDNLSHMGSANYPSSRSQGRGRSQAPQLGGCNREVLLGLPLGCGWRT